MYKEIPPSSNNYFSSSFKMVSLQKYGEHTFNGTKNCSLFLPQKTALKRLNKNHKQTF